VGGSLLWRTEELALYLDSMKLGKQWEKDLALSHRRGIRWLSAVRTLMPNLRTRT